MNKCKKTHDWKKCINPSFLWYFDISGKSKTIKQHSHISEIYLIYYLQSGYSHKNQNMKMFIKIQ